MSIVPKYKSRWHWKMNKLKINVDTTKRNLSVRRVYWNQQKNPVRLLLAQLCFPKKHFQTKNDPAFTLSSLPLEVCSSPESMSSDSPVCPEYAAYVGHAELFLEGRCHRSARGGRGCSYFRNASAPYTTLTVCNVAQGMLWWQAPPFPSGLWTL